MRGEVFSGSPLRARALEPDPARHRPARATRGSGAGRTSPSRTGRSRP
jgi:hypothetical protein